MLASFLSRPRSFAFVFPSHSTDPPGCTNIPLFRFYTYPSVLCSLALVLPLDLILPSSPLCAAFSKNLPRPRPLFPRRSCPLSVASFPRPLSLDRTSAAAACLTAAWPLALSTAASSILVGRFGPGQISRIPQGGDVESTDRSACSLLALNVRLPPGKSTPRMLPRYYLSMAEF